MIPTSRMPSTGEQRVESPQLKTKADAVHAGPSVRLLPWRTPISEKLDTLTLFQSNNLSHAQRVIMVAEVDGNLQLLIISIPTHKPQKKNTHMFQGMVKQDIAQLPRSPLVGSPHLATEESNHTAHHNSKQPSKRVLSQSPLMQAAVCFNNTDRVFLTQMNVVPILTTPLLLLVGAMMNNQAMTTISLETHGQAIGETKVTSRLLLSKDKVYAVSKLKA